jgi:hypothetical protein
VVAGVVQLVGTSFAAQHQPARRPLDALGYALLAAGPAATLGRRRHPVAVLAVVFVLTRLYLALDYPEGPIYLALIVAFFTTMLAGHRLVGWLVLAAGYVTFLWLDPLLGRGPAPSLLEGTALAAWLLVLGGSAEIVRVRRAYLRATELRAEQAERTRAYPGERSRAPAPAPLGAGRKPPPTRRRRWGTWRKISGELSRSPRRHPVPVRHQEAS